MTVYELAEKLLQDKEVSATYGRDLVLSLVIAHCNIARDLLMDQKVRRMRQRLPAAPAPWHWG